MGLDAYLNTVRVLGGIGIDIHVQGVDENTTFHHLATVLNWNTRAMQLL